MQHANKIFLTLLLILSGGIVVQAQSELEMESVSIFKNSTAFFVKKGKVKTKDKKWRMVGDTIPKALNGTFWLSSPTNDLRIARSFQEDLESRRLVTQYADLLYANDGKRIRFMRSWDTTWVTGKVKIISMKNPDPSAKQKEIKSGALYAIEQSNGSLLMLKANDVNTFKQLEFLDTPNFTNPQIERKPIVELEFGSANTQQGLDLMYLSNGLSWKPDYLIELTGDDKAQLSLRTTIVNNAEDVKVKKLNLVAGVPNFKYASTISDFLNLGNIYAQYAARNPNVLSNYAVFDNERVTEDLYAPAPTTITTTGNAPNPPRPAVGNSVEDLFYYTLEDIEIKKEQRALLDVFSKEVPVEHVYETILKQNQATYSTAYRFEDKRIPVVHTIELENISDYVWTAAPALVVKSEKGKISPISQDRLNYTSKKDHVNVKLTEAPDVAVEFTEEEIERDVNDKQIKQYKDRILYYDLITVKSEIEIQNFKDKDIRIDVKRAIVGELLKSSEKWLKAPRPQRYANFNPFTEVCWELEVKAGETKKFEFTYKVYVSHY